MPHDSLPSSNSHLREILALAIPAMLAQASLPLLNIGETAMIGRLSAEALAARAVGAAIIGTVYWLFAFLTFGTTSLIGHHYGGYDGRCPSPGFRFRGNDDKEKVDFESLASKSRGLWPRVVQSKDMSDDSRTGLPLA